MKEFSDESGVYSVPVEDLPESVWFLRNKIKSKDGKLGKLLHVCERDIDPQSEVPFYVVLAGMVRWDSFRGKYWCEVCKDEWGADDDEHLRAIWEDGDGIGVEGHA